MFRDTYRKIVQRGVFLLLGFTICLFSIRVGEVVCWSLVLGKGKKYKIKPKLPPAWTVFKCSSGQSSCVRASHHLPFDKFNYFPSTLPYPEINRTPRQLRDQAELVKLNCKANFNSETRRPFAFSRPDFLSGSGQSWL